MTMLKMLKLSRPLPPELLSEMHKCLPINEQIELIGNVPSRVIVLNNAKRVRRKLQHIREALNAKSVLETSNQPKEWQRLITPDVRNHMVGELVKVLDPYRKPTDLINGDYRIKDLLSIANAPKMERECFEMAADKESYCKMVFDYSA